MQNGFAVTNKGNLPCKMFIFHLETPELSDLKEALYNLLKVADTMNIKSISIPSIGTGK